VKQLREALAEIAPQKQGENNVTGIRVDVYSQICLEKSCGAKLSTETLGGMPFPFLVQFHKIHLAHACRDVNGNGDQLRINGLIL
jgi:hypothetical protein